MLKAEGLSKSFEHKGTVTEIVRDISFTVEPGTILSLLGASGSGKSTILNLLCGLLPPDSGRIEVDGETLAAPRPDRIAFMFQEALLLPWKTVWENVHFPIRHGKVGTRDAAAVDHYLNLVGLTPYKDYKPRQLSGGMRQRVALARCLAQGASYILMDEPFSALDEERRYQLGQDLLHICEAQSKGVVLVTHSITEALALSDRVLVLGARPGRILHSFDVPRLTGSYLERLDMAEIRAMGKEIRAALQADGRSEQDLLDAQAAT